MTAAMDPRIIGTGHAVPPSVRLNDDPYFDALRKKVADPNARLFYGYERRHFLAPGETVAGLMTEAARMALAEAQIAPSQVDLLIGDASVSTYILPNDLSQVHRDLGLPASCWPLALTSGFSQFNAAAMMADALIRAGRARHVLIVLGSNWTGHVHPEDAQAASAGDGAAACVIGPARSAADWALIDSRTLADTGQFGGMFMAGDPVPGPAGATTTPAFHITPDGAEGFTTFAMRRPQELATEQLLSRPELHQKDGIWQNLCLTSHQATRKLMDAWSTAIRPQNQIDTLRDYANMVQCSTLFNLSWGLKMQADFRQDWLQTLCLGPDMHVNVSLFRRNF